LQKYLKVAEDLIVKANYAQASKKLREGFVEAVEAVAEARGEKLGTDRSIGQ